jgi:hypothetical protein
MELQTYDTMVMLHNFMWPGDPRPLRNTYAAFGVGDPVCAGVPSVARVLADDIEYPECTGVVDFPARSTVGLTAQLCSGPTSTRAG